MSQDPYAPYLRQADDLLARGELVKAGQIWQAILKQAPQHAEARGRLMQVKQRLLALREAEAAAEPPATAAPEAPALVVAEPPPPPSPAPTAFPPVVEDPPPPPAVPVPTQVAIPEPPPFPPPTLTTPPPPSSGVEPERLVIEGCTLYDMGQVGDALRKWEQVLTLDPGHRLAREYANGARRDLGLPPLEAPAPPDVVGAGPSAEEDDIDKLLREAVQLYDIGLVEEAVSKWERVLTIDPSRREVQAYLHQARAELGERPEAPAPPAPATRPGGPDPGLLELRLRQAAHLLSLQRHEEAAFTYQQALALDPGNALARQGLERCRPGHPVAQPLPPPAAPALSLDAQGRISMAEPDPDRTQIVEPRAVAPPASLVKAAPAPRKGLSLPGQFQALSERFPWLREPRILAAVGGGVLVLALGLGLVHRYQRDQDLKHAVEAARAAALAPLSQQALDLVESPADIRQEAESTLVTDPLRAYLRASTLVQRNPNDAGGAQLLEQARAALPGGAVGATLAEYQKHLKDGDLDAAARVMDALLRATPDDPDLRARAARLQLALCSAHAAQGKWDDATLDLQRGRALFPSDKAWQARLKLLDHVRALPKDQRGNWISLLG